MKKCEICKKDYKGSSVQKTKYCSPSCRSMSHSQRKLIGEEGLDYIICKVCNLKFKEINNDHVRTHGISCEEYDNTYGYNKRTSEKTRLKKDTLSGIMNSELSKKLSHSHSEENYIDKYGEEEGRIRHHKKIELQKYKNGSKYYTDRYGYEDGLKKFKEVKSKCTISLEKLIVKYGEIEGTKRYNSWREIQKTKSTLSYFIGKYGDDGFSKWSIKNNKISLSNSKITKEDKKLFDNYSIKVDKLTRISLSINKLDLIELRGIKEGYDLDHIVSKVNGFRNNIDPCIIAHISNLRIIRSSQNRKKQHKSDIDIEVITDKYINDISDYKLIISKIYL